MKQTRTVGVLCVLASAVLYSIGGLCMKVIPWNGLSINGGRTAIALVSLAVLGVFQVAMAYILLTIGLKTTPPVTASLVSGIEPVLNPILVAVFYHETMGRFALVGAAIVVLGVVGYNVIQARQGAKTT